ncbi:hypothetical protein FJZ55_09985, partial [Candidatus Woesearchaeota archaeon]|nr:hypothetical protein [Candidatus Woesearchaeota archaeon]
MHRAFRPRALPVLLAALPLSCLAACPPPTVVQPIQITEVSYSQTIVLPGETISIAATATGADSLSYAWSTENDVGTFGDPSAAGTTWTAPLQEQLVELRLLVTASEERSAEHRADLLVGVGRDHDGDGFSMRQGDCDDTNDGVYPGSPDIADGIDNDCDGELDEGSSGSDDDGDGFAETEGDCDDAAATVFPGAEETENGVDDDCDSVIDEETDAFDDDGDGASEDGGDCNDDSSSVGVGAPEILDGVDNDCDGVIDEGTAAFDDDGDGFSEVNGDCDDSASTGPLSFPGNPELPDGLDNDCDGLPDEDFADDEDGDGWSELAGDCDDADFYSYPGAPEFDDGLDNDCDGFTDEAMDSVDDDEDGFSEADGDCDDGLPQVYPGAPEVADPILELDNDCDGWFVTNPPFAVGTLGALSGCNNGNDDDGDGWEDGADPDCLVGYAETGTGFTQCNDGVDNDFDGQMDWSDP